MIVLRDRVPERGDDPDAIYCGDCWERVRMDLSERPALINGRSTGWRHVRTGDWRCTPVCDAEPCAEPGTVPLGRRVWNGHGFEFRARHFVCPVHYEALQRERLIEEYT